VIIFKEFVKKYILDTSNISIMYKAFMSRGCTSWLEMSLYCSSHVSFYVSGSCWLCCDCLELLLGNRLVMHYYFIYYYRYKPLLIPLYSAVESYLFLALYHFHMHVLVMNDSDPHLACFSCI
jgi:hypothetical protein